MTIYRLMWKVSPFSFLWLCLVHPAPDFVVLLACTLWLPGIVRFISLTCCTPFYWNPKFCILYSFMFLHCTSKSLIMIYCLINGFFLLAHKQVIENLKVLIIDNVGVFILMCRDGRQLKAYLRGREGKIRAVCYKNSMSVSNIYILQLGWKWFYKTVAAERNRAVYVGCMPGSV